MDRKDCRVGLIKYPLVILVFLLLILPGTGCERPASDGYSSSYSASGKKSPLKKTSHGLQEKAGKLTIKSEESLEASSQRLNEKTEKLPEENISGDSSFHGEKSTVGASKESLTGVIRESLPLFEVFRVRYITIERSMEGLGTLGIVNKATVVSRIEGILEEVYVKKGDSVGEGQPLFYVSNYQLELDKDGIEKELIEAGEELESAELQLREDERLTYRKLLQIEKLKLQREDLKEEIDYLEGSLEKKRVLREKGGMTEEAFGALVFSLESKKRELGILDKEIDIQEFGFRDEDLLRAGFDVPEKDDDKKKLLVLINTELQRKRIEFARIRLKKAELAKKRVEWFMELRTVRAPVSGIVAGISKYPGEKVGRDQVLTTIIDNSLLSARVSFPESRATRMKKGTKVQVVTGSLSGSGANVYSASGSVHSSTGQETRGNAYGFYNKQHGRIAESRADVGRASSSYGKIFSGVLTTIDPVVDTETRSIWIECEVKNDGTLLPGMFVKVVLPVAEKARALIIPADSVVRTGEGTGYVFIVSETGRIYRKRIYIDEPPGQGEDGKISNVRGNVSPITVIDGLAEGDMIMSKPIVNLGDGTRIRYREVEPF